MRYFINIFTNYRNIFVQHRELLFNLINYQVFLRSIGFIVLFWAGTLFTRAMLEGSPFLLNYETFWPLLSIEVIFYWILYIFLFAIFIFLEKIGLNLILFQNEKNPKFLLGNIYKEILRNLRKIIYLVFLEFAIVSFIIWWFLFFTLFFYIFAGMNTLFWMLEFLLTIVFWYMLIKAYLFFIFVNFEVFYVKKNVFEAFSLSIRWVNKKRTISHLATNYTIIIGGIFTINFLVTSWMFFLWSIILMSVNFITIWIVSLLMSFTFILMILSSFLLLSLLSIVEFQIYKKEIRSEKPELNIKPPDDFHINKSILFITFLSLTIIICIPLFFTLSDYNPSPKIVWHTWAPLVAPGNTLSSVSQAMKLWVDVIELDVQKTLDGEIVVFHDKNLKKYTGYNGNLYETPYEEIQELEVWSHFSEAFRWEKIPKLEEVIQLVEDSDIDLNIELKVYQHGKDYSEKIADILKKYNFEDRAVVTSLDLNILEQFRKHNTITDRWLILTLIVGNIFHHDVEFISVNSKILTLPMIIKSKIYGKKLHVWIYNQKDDVTDIIWFWPDSIIVDDIEEALRERIIFENLSDRKKIQIKIENIIDYLSGKLR